MYEKLFQSANRPFRATPDTKYYFAHENIETARQTVLRAIVRAEGPAMVLGGAGYGKSLLGELIAGDLCERLDIVRLQSARLCSRRALLQNILFELRLPYRDLSEGELRLSILDRLEPSPELAPEGVLFIVDEAHTLPSKLLDELRLLNNFTRNNQPRTRLLLLGSMRLEDTFAQPQMDSFNQRIAARCYLQPMNRSETMDFVRSQLTVAGADPRSVITQDGLEAVYAASEGVPRIANQIMDHAFVLAIANAQSPISAALIEEAWADLQQLPAPWSGSVESSQAASSVEFGTLEDEESEGASASIEDEWDSEPSGNVPAMESGSFFQSWSPSEAAQSESNEPNAETVGGLELDASSESSFVAFTGFSSPEMSEDLFVTTEVNQDASTSEPAADLSVVQYDSEPATKQCKNSACKNETCGNRCGERGHRETHAAIAHTESEPIIQEIPEPNMNLEDQEEVIKPRNFFAAFSEPTEEEDVFDEEVEDSLAHPQEAASSDRPNVEQSVANRETDLAKPQQVAPRVVFDASVAFGHPATRTQVSHADNPTDSEESDCDQPAETLSLTPADAYDLERLGALEDEQGQYDAMGVWENDPPLMNVWLDSDESKEPSSTSAPVAARPLVAADKNDIFGSDFEEEIPVPVQSVVTNVQDQGVFVDPDQQDINDYVTRIQQYADAIQQANQAVEDEAYTELTELQTTTGVPDDNSAWTLNVAPADLATDEQLADSIEDIVSQLNFSAFLVEPFSVEQISLESTPNEVPYDSIRTGGRDEVYMLHRAQDVNGQATFTEETLTYDDDRDMLVIEEEVPVSNRLTEQTASGQPQTKVTPYSKLFSQLRK